MQIYERKEKDAEGRGLYALDIRAERRSLGSKTLRFKQKQAERLRQGRWRIIVHRATHHGWQNRRNA